MLNRISNASKIPLGPNHSSHSFIMGKFGFWWGFCIPPKSALYWLNQIPNSSKESNKTSSGCGIFFTGTADASSTCGQKIYCATQEIDLSQFQNSL